MRGHYLDQRIRIKKPSLSLTEKEISDCFIHPESLLTQMTLEGLANEIGVSQFSVYQFVKEISYSGFQEFEIDIVRSSSYQPTLQSVNSMNSANGISPDDDSITIAKKILQASIYSLSNATQFLTKKLLDNALALMYSTKALHFFGQGGSSIMAFDSLHKFIRTSYRCNYIFDYHMQLGSVARLTSKDCVSISSRSGKTKGSINLIRQIKKTNAKTITLTDNSGSELAGLSDEAIIIVTGKGLFRAESLASRIGYSTVMDILCTDTMYHNFDQSADSLKKIRGNISMTKTDPHYSS